jgi:protein-L-isoaspartate(D-aspartate) O-methyltransferase
VRSRTVEDLVRAARAVGVRDERVLDAIRAVPRAAFVPADRVEEAYWDGPVPIPHGQVTTQPSLVARMVEAARVAASDRVLEVGAGYGWQTALLARLGAWVWSVERWADIAETARERLAAAGAWNVEVVVGDGSEGLPEHAPYDAVLVSAAFPSVPAPLADQVVLGGRLLQPIGPGGFEEVVVFERGPRGLERRRVVALARFVRLRGRYGYR